jgi:hypothetical protein
MTRYSNVKDVTMHQKGASPGMAFRKACSSCGQHKEIRGGSVYSRLRLWRCADCTQKARGEA